MTERDQRIAEASARAHNARMAIPPRDQANRYDRLRPEARALLEGYDELDLADMLVTARAQLAALREVARGYCPACGRGDAAPSVADWEQQWDRADQAEQERDQLRHLRAVTGIHFRAIGHHLNDADIQLPTAVFRLCQLVDDELTLTLTALAQQHPHALDVTATTEAAQATGLPALLRAEAVRIVAGCPDHGDGDRRWGGCHCKLAAEERQRADRMEAGS